MGFFCHIWFHSRDSVFCLVVIVLLKFQTLENLVAGIGNRGCYVSKDRAVFKITLFIQWQSRRYSASPPPLRVCLLCVLSVIMPAWIAVLVLFTLSLTKQKDLSRSFWESYVSSVCSFNHMRKAIQLHCKNLHVLKRSPDLVLETIFAQRW